MAYAFIAYLYALFAVISDLFRDHKLSGWVKAVWMVFLVFVPFLTLLIYMVVRGNDMEERSRKASRLQHESAQAYVRQVAKASPSEEISKAKTLLDSGAISADEFAQIKSTVRA